MRPTIVLPILVICGLLLLNFISKKHPDDPKSKKNTKAARVVSSTKSSSFEGASAELAYTEHIKGLYTLLELGKQGLSFEIFEKAITGYYNLKSKNVLSEEKNILSVIDYRLPSTSERLWIINLDQKKLLYHSLVAHGKKSG